MSSSRSSSSALGSTTSVFGQPTTRSSSRTSHLKESQTNLKSTTRRPDTAFEARLKENLAAGDLASQQQAPATFQPASSAAGQGAQGTSVFSVPDVGSNGAQIPSARQRPGASDGPSLWDRAGAASNPQMVDLDRLSKEIEIMRLKGLSHVDAGQLTYMTSNLAWLSMQDSASAAATDAHLSDLLTAASPISARGLSGAATDAAAAAQPGPQAAPARSAAPFELPRRGVQPAAATPDGGRTFTFTAGALLRPLPTGKTLDLPRECSLKLVLHLQDPAV